MTFKLTLKPFALLVILLGCSSCGDYETKITLKGGAIPIFYLSGSGKIIKFTINGPQQRKGEGPEAYVVWEFKPNVDTDDLNTLSNMRLVTYGVTPRGYKQIYPENNSSPPSIIEGETYLLQIFTDNAPSGQIAFVVNGGKVSEKPIN